MCPWVFVSSEKKKGHKDAAENTVSELPGNPFSRKEEEVWCFFMTSYVTVRMSLRRNNEIIPQLLLFAVLGNKTERNYASKRAVIACSNTIFTNPQPGEHCKVL